MAEVENDAHEMAQAGQDALAHHPRMFSRHFRESARQLRCNGDLVLMLVNFDASSASMLIRFDAMV